MLNSRPQTSMSSKSITGVIKRATDSLKSKITLDLYYQDPDKYEVLNCGRIVDKEVLSEAQSNFRKKYDLVREFFE